MLRNLLVGLGLILGLTLGAPVVEAAPITLTVVTACGTPPTPYTVGQAFPGTQDTTGKLCDTGSGGGGGGGTSSTFGAAFPATGTAAGFNDGTNMQGARVFDGDSGAGTEYDVGTILRVPASGGSVAASFGDVNNAASAAAIQDDLTVARYNATLPTLTDTRYNSLQVGQRGALQVQVMNADGTTGWAFAAPADGQSLAASSAPVRGIMGVYNGSTTDLTREIVNATNSTGTGILAAGILAQFDDVAPTSITENQFGNVRMSANRNQYTTIRDAAGNERGANVNASNQLSVSIDGSSATNLSTNIAQMNGVAVTMGNGVSGTGVQRVTLASDSTGNIATIGTSVTPGTGATNLGKAEDQASASADVGVGALAVQQSTPADTAADGDYSYLQMKNGALFVANVPTTANGLSNYVVEPAASDNHATIKAGAGQVYSIAVFNNSATINYIRLYNATTAFNGCNSATNLAWEGNIPASTSGAGFIYDVSQGISFSTGISICVTSTYGQTSVTNATASAMSVNVSYK